MNTDVVDLKNATALGNPPAKPSQEMGKNEFLKLLMTQLSAQDPMNPMDSTQFTAQLSQFASLEQLSNMSNKLDSLISISGASNAANAVSLLGKDVRVDNSKVKGPIKAYYELESQARDVRMEVRDKDGHVVHAVTGLSGDKGLQEVNLEGFPPGEYTINLVAVDAQNKEVKSKLSTLERVNAVNFVGNVPQVLTQSGQTIAASSVLEIRAPQL